MKCRFCQSSLNLELIDLVSSPPSNSYLSEEQLNLPEIYYPLKVMVCTNCWLVQIDEFKKHDEIFNENYAYFSSFSTSWLAHCNQYVSMITERLGLDETSSVMEIASNDGYLLQYFQEKNIHCLGIEPTESTALECQKKGIDTIIEFFGVKLAEKLAIDNKLMDLIVGNNVLAHVPDVNDFVKGIKRVLKPSGVITMEFPHLLKLLKESQFDTIYHEHYSYISLFSAIKIFSFHGLRIFDVEELPTHGGSLRIFACHEENNAFEVSDRVNQLLAIEKKEGLQDETIYRSFSEKIDSIKINFIQFLINSKAQGNSVIGYGAAAKGNTLLNYCGVRSDLIQYAVDASPHKVGKFLPGSHIAVVGEESIRKTKPDYIIILPWNLQDEIKEKLSYVRVWGCKFVVAIPEMIID